MILLTGCQNNQSFACSRYSGDNSIVIELNGSNDKIMSFHVREAFKLPHTLLYEEKNKAFLDEQLDDSCHYENNYLIKEYDLYPDQKYSLQMTLENLKDRRYFCE